MVIYAQHGFGKSDYVQEGLNKGHIAGVILSPKDEEPSDMAQFARTLRSKYGTKATILFDPQFYATTITSANAGSLPSYSYYAPALTRAAFDPESVQKYAKAVIQYQSTLGVDKFIGPAISFGDFKDSDKQIAVFLGQAAIAARDSIAKKPLLLTVAFDEVALKNREALEEFLDDISSLRADGFYILVKRGDPNYPAAFEEDPLVNLMYLVYVLAELNEFEVICGYSDLVGTLLHAVGATATGSGWYTNLKQFSFKRFQKSEGGRQPRDRYSSLPLMNSILVTPELESVYAAGLLDQVITGTKYDTVMRSGPAGATWPRKTSCLHHWEVLRRLALEASAGKTISDNLAFLETRVQRALTTYRTLGNAGISFETPSSSRDLLLWQRVVKRFRTEVGL